MIVEFTTEEEVQKLLLEGHIADLKSYCEAEGFTEKQTKLFIKNTLEAEEERRYAELPAELGEL